MLKVQATNGNTFAFDADKWTASDGGLFLFKGADLIAQFSSYNFVQVVADPVVEAPEEPPVAVEPEPEVPEPEPEIQPEEPEAPQDETTEPLA